MWFVNLRAFVLICILFVIIPVTVLTSHLHDWQRVSQCAIGLISWLLLCINSKQEDGGGLVSPYARSCLIIILSAGLLSSYFSAHILWALAEVALTIICVCLASAIAYARRAHGERTDRALFLLVLMLCILKCIQFIAISLAAFTDEISTIDTSLLIDGFSNRRFYGQFQTLTLPLLALPLLLVTLKNTTKAWVFALLTCWWMIAICGGTRGTWLGMGCSAAVIVFCGPFGRRWFYWQSSAAISGFLLFWCFFSLLPRYLGIDIVNFAGDRLTTTLSARDVIWHQAWGMIKERPFLGFGPMHFADIHNLIAAHPHQAILQWACEWGVPSTLVVCWLVAKGHIATLALVRQKTMSSKPVDLLRLCLFASLLGTLAQSMVDGVIVMPYSQLWLAIVVGWLMGIHEWSVKPPSGGRFFRWGWRAVIALAVGFLAYIVIRDYSHLDEREQRYAHDFGGNLQPRFWQQGVIADKPE